VEKSLEIVVWVPLSPSVVWADGIGRTIENVLKNLPSNILCDLVVSKHHYIELVEIFNGYQNIKIKSIGLGFKKKQIIVTPGRHASSNGVVSFIAQKIGFPLKIIKKFDCFVKKVKYAIDLVLYSLLQRANLFLPNCQILWFPVPFISALSLLKGKKVFSFWDPFVFEYREFSDINHNILMKLNAIFYSSNYVITQSEANKDFLVNVLQIDSDEIEVVNNGSPSYANFMDEFSYIGKRNKNDLLIKWLKDKYISENESIATNKLTHDLINKAVLWRLLSKLVMPEDKVLMISTQIRPYKGFGLLLKFLDKLVSEEKSFKYHIIFTAVLSKNEKDRYPLIYERIHEITRVSDSQHALLYYISDLVLHPSFVEGGLGVYPQFEAASLGIPCLVNTGRHTFEQSPTGDNMLYHAVDFTKVDKLIFLVNELMSSSEKRSLNIKETLRLAIPWQESAKKYGEIFSRLINGK